MRSVRLKRFAETDAPVIRSIDIEQQPDTSPLADLVRVVEREVCVIPTYRIRNPLILQAQSELFIAPVAPFEITRHLDAEDIIKEPFTVLPIEVELPEIRIQPVVRTLGIQSNSSAWTALCGSQD